MNNLKFAIRQLRKSRGFTTVAVLTLALGIGTCTAMFSIVNAVLLKPLPFHEPERLVWIENVYGDSGLSGRTSRVDAFLGWRDQTKCLESIAAYFAFSDYGSLMMTGAREPERLRGVGVSGNFLTTLGVPLLHGRNFTTEECAFNGPGAVILSHGYWKRRFAGDPSVVGRTISLNNKPGTVIGVLPASFDFASVFTPGSPVDVLTAFPLTPETTAWGNTVFGIGRLRPGVSPDKAQAELTVISERLQATTLKNAGPFGAKTRTLDAALRGKFRGAFLMLAAAVVCVLAIACVNLSNLLVARQNERSQEFMVRRVLGARRRDLVRQSLTESLLLAFAGSAIGAPLAAWVTSLITRIEVFGVPMLQNAGVDYTALWVTIGVTTAAGIACGLLPALQLFRGGGAGGTPDATHQRSAGRSAASARGVLVVAEVALACMLLVGAGLLIRSFQAVMEVNLGFAPQNAVAWRLDGVREFRQFKSAEEVEAYFGGLVRRVGSIPGVEAAGLSDTLPLGRNRSWGAAEVGVQYPPGKYPDAFPRLVDPNYLKAMKIPLIAGRQFDEVFNPKAEKAVVINENMARMLWPGSSPLGRKITANGESTVIGVVANVRHSSLEESSGNEMYLDYRQCGDWSTLEMVVRSRRPMETLVPAVRAALAEYDTKLPTTGFYKLERLVDDAVGPRKFITRLLGFFSGLALALAATGLYGVIAYSVTQRTQEIGIRMAVGAQRSDVLGLIAKGGLGLVAIGGVVGLAGSFALSRLLQSMLYGVSSHDPLVYLADTALLFVAAGAACVIPAIRATRVDPMVALRNE